MRSDVFELYVAIRLRDDVVEISISLIQSGMYVRGDPSTQTTEYEGVFIRKLE